jgi:uncharacterized damage-inducible protein DinB
MQKREIGILVQFNFWADAKILVACDQLGFEQLKQPITPDPGWGNLLGILVHILDAEYGWRSVLQSQSADKILKPEDFADLASFKSRWEDERTAWMKFVSSLNKKTINQPFPASPHNGPKVWQTIIHVVTHGIQHRSEAAAILTGYGQSPGELDFDNYIREISGYLSPY